ncbi:MAG: hypothetical protein M1504_01515 [Candidatus Marsarchaeota archaeon]|nr:hypothetical protein [Candidatus Marsarchaeota archaeon]
MPLNPDDLLIFKARQEAPAAKKKKKGTETAVSPETVLERAAPKAVEQPQQPQPQQKPQKPIQVQQPQPVQKTQAQKFQPQPQQPKQKPQQAEQTTPSPIRYAEAKPSAVEQPKPKPQPKYVEERPRATEQPRPEPKPEIEYRSAEEKHIIEELNVTPQIVVGTPVEAMEEGGISEEAEPETFQPKKLKKMKPKDVRRIASHMSCELHPWRKAYAICNYCKRAFCYEDIVEQGGMYYCLDDVDKVPQAEKKALVIKYNTLSMVSGVLFLAMALMYGYLNYGSSLAFVLAIPSHLSHISAIPGLVIADWAQIAEMLLAFMALLSAIIIVVKPGRGFLLGNVTGVLVLLVFAYQYMTVKQLQLAIMAGIALAAMILLAYSRSSYETVPEDTESYVNEGVFNVAKGSF